MAEAYNEVEKLQQVLRWDKKGSGLVLRHAGSVHTEQVSFHSRI